MIRRIRRGAMVALAVAGLWVGQAHAQAATKTLAWDPVTQTVNGTPTTVDKYTMYRSTDGGTTFAKLADVAGTSLTDSNIPTGNICYQVTASNFMGESAASNRLCFQVPDARPQAPRLRAQ